MEPTTVSYDRAVFHRRVEDLRGADPVVEHSGLEPDCDYQLESSTFRTLLRPAGERLCRVAAVNDLHFGETTAGLMGKEVVGDVVTRRPGEAPHPLLMNASVVQEIKEISPAAVVVKGDITDTSQDEEFAAFEDCYASAFGDRLFAVRGNHESFHRSTRYSDDHWVELPGVALAVLDTCVDGADGGNLSGSQLDWLVSHLEATTVPVLIFGHHPPYLPGYGDNPGQTLDIESSEALVALCTAMPSVLSYSAGHSHRTRSRSWAGVTYSEVGCVKDFPGLWTEFEVFEGGVVQLVHRLRNREAVAWSDSCRNLYKQIGIEYETYAFGSLADRCTVLKLRG